MGRLVHLAPVLEVLDLVHQDRLAHLVVHLVLAHLVVHLALALVRLVLPYHLLVGRLVHLVPVLEVRLVHLVPVLGVRLAHLEEVHPVVPFLLQVPFQNLLQSLHCLLLNPQHPSQIQKLLEDHLD